MNSKEEKDKAYADGDAAGRRGGYGFFEQLADSHASIIMTKDEKELNEINMKGKVHGANERSREEVEAFLRPSSNKPSSKSKFASTPSKVQYEPSDRDSYGSDYGSGGGSSGSGYYSGASSFSHSPTSPDIGTAFWVIIIIGLIIAAFWFGLKGCVATIDRVSKIGPSSVYPLSSKPNYSSAAHYYPQSSPVSTKIHSVEKPSAPQIVTSQPASQSRQARIDTLMKKNQLQPTPSTTPSPPVFDRKAELSRLKQKYGSVQLSTEAVSETSEAVAESADWSSLNRLKKAVENQSKEIEEALNLLNGGGN